MFYCILIATKGQQLNFVVLVLLYFFTFTFALLYTFFLSGLKATKFKKTKIKKGVRIQAILGRIRTLDPVPGHFGPDFDSGSGPESTFTDPGLCAAFTHSRIRISVENSDFLR